VGLTLLPKISWVGFSRLMSWKHNGSQAAR